MPIEEWKIELIFTGNIVQDCDTSVPDDEARRCLRYVELLDMVDGSEGEDVFKAVVGSIQVEEDYEVYETTHNVLWSFPPEKFGPWMVASLPTLIDRMASVDYQVGRFLCPLRGWEVDEYLPQFNAALGRAPAQAQEKIMEFVLRNEQEGGWFDDAQGLIRPSM